jgi:excisionase family DNA binding protein
VSERKAAKGMMTELGGSALSPSDRLVPKLLLSYEEACWSLSVCERTLRNMVARGQLVAVKIGGRTLFDPADLRAAIEAHRTLPQQTQGPSGPKSVQ